ncbi:MAG: alkyl sulfatase dimerization domain-containing protein [Burkholderiaceae bacterium]
MSEDTTVRIAGTTVRLVPAPSDSDDTLIIHFPELDCVVNNHVWPVLYNIYTLRGEKYRDPRQFVKAIDLIRQMDPQHLVGVHGPPITPRENARQALLDYRDSIQYLWDQTVRGMNNGLTTEQIVEQVALPDHLEHSPYIPQVYGEVPFHVRAICNGELGWFDMDGSRLHPVPPREEADKMIAGFGGRAAMMAAVQKALADEDWSWAAQLAAYLHRSDPADPDGRRLKALALRGIARVTPAANTRSVCLTEALTLEGAIDPMAHTPWRANRFRLMGAAPGRFVEALRVRLDPHRSARLRQTLAFSFTDPVAHCALQIDRGLARYLDGDVPGAELRLELTLATWADLYTGKRSLAEVSAAGQAVASPSVEAVVAWFDHFDHIRLG